LSFSEKQEKTGCDIEAMQQALCSIQILSSFQKKEKKEKESLRKTEKSTMFDSHHCH